MKDVLSRVLIGTVVVIWLFFGLKGCVVTTWISPKTSEIYSAQNESGRSLVMVFLPKHETMIWHIDPNNDTIEGVLTKMRGTYGTHYFGGLWHVDRPNEIFEYRIYPANTKPVNMEIIVLDKVVQGRGASIFSNKGGRSYQTILFGDDGIKFQDIWLRKQEHNEEMVRDLLNNFSVEESR